MDSHYHQNLVWSKTWYLMQIIQRSRINKCLTWSGHSPKRAARSNDRADAVPARMLCQHPCLITQWQTGSILLRRTTTCKPLLWYLVEQWMAANRRSTQIWEASTTARAAGLLPQSWDSKRQTRACTKTEEAQVVGKSEQEHQTAGEATNRLRQHQARTRRTW